MMIRKIFTWFLLVIIFTVSGINYVNAQAEPPGDPGDDPDRVPLDPGSWVLVAAGVGYGVKKWRDAKNSSSVVLNKQPESSNSKDQ